MRFKKFLYSVLLFLFILALIADLGLWFLVPDAQTSAETGTLPEGMTLPEGVTLPEGMTFPEGATVPEGGFPGSFPGSGSFPEGATFPGSGEGSDGSSRPSRPGRSRSEGETTEEIAGTDAATETAAEPSLGVFLKAWFSARVAELQEYLPLAELTPVKEMVAPYRLYILIGASVGMVLCIIRLIFINRKLRKLWEELEAAGDYSHRRVALWPAYLLLLGALVLVALLFPVNEEEEAADGAVTNAQVLSGKVEEKDLTSLIQSTGSLEEQEAVTVEIPASVSIASVCVKNGDTVTAGQILAKVDQTALMKSIASVHEAMDDIDGQLQDAHEAKGSKTLTAPVDGIVKAVYAEPGQKAIDVMEEHGALMLLSLDGCMAVQVPAGDELTMGSAVIVTLSDGDELPGQVSYLEEGMATVTVADRGYAIGEQVSVKDEAGVLLGSGSLYVHKALKVTGYLGTVTRIYRSEGRAVTADTALLSFSDTANLADYQELLQKRAAYEEELMRLFEIYQDGYIHAACDGVVQGLSDEYTYSPLSDMVAGLTVRLLAADNNPLDEDTEGYVNYLGIVSGRTGSQVTLDNVGQVNMTDYSSLPAPSGQMNGGVYTISTSAIYQFSGGWSQITANDIWINDRILFTFNSEGGLVWVIVQRTDESTEPQAPNPPSGPNGGHSGFGGKISGPTGASTQEPTYTVGKNELCTITPQERMLITVPIDELDVLALSLGQEAELYLDALPNTALQATVTKIDPEGTNSGGNTKYSVTLSLDRSAQLYPGMNGTVCFPRKVRAGAMTVPLAAVTEEGNRIVVYRAYDEETDQLLDPVEVQTGVSDGTDVEILSGLSLGDAYYYRYADAISYVTE